MCTLVYLFLFERVNSIDPEEIAHYEPPHLDLRSLLFGLYVERIKTPGPSCSKLMTSLVNDSLKFKANDMQIC